MEPPAASRERKALMITPFDTPVGRLVAERPCRARVFERLGIDYCCGGKKPLGEACAGLGLDPAVVLRELERTDAQDLVEGELDWSTATLTDLVDHIEAVHHAYLREALPRLTSLVEKVAGIHGGHHPELSKLRWVFLGFRDEIEAHMTKEEHVLFPMCRALEVASVPPRFHCGTIRNPIRAMELEHDDAGSALAAMRTLTHGFTPPPDACNTFRAMLHGLAELEADMHLHVHEENNILFPRASAIEAELAQRTALEEAAIR
jgi:regulator of cell morphogenesis and NO signaling